MDSLFVTLKSLQDNSQNTQYLSLTIALLAVFFGPIMSYFSARLTIRHQLSSLKEQLSTQVSVADRTIKSQVLSRNRQDWINTLRDTISDFIAILFVIAAAKLPLTQDNLRAEKLFSLRIKILLLLNPSEDDHKQLDSYLDECMQYCDDRISGVNPKREFKAIRRDITDISQKILKREWERVKKIE